MWLSPYIQVILEVVHIIVVAGYNLGASDSTVSFKYDELTTIYNESNS